MTVIVTLSEGSGIAHGGSYFSVLCCVPRNQLQAIDCDKPQGARAAANSLRSSPSPYTTHVALENTLLGFVLVRPCGAPHGL